MHACSGWQDLRDLLQQWQASGKLRRLAASLTFASAADAPPATAAGSARHAQQGGGSKRRALGRQAQEGAERPAPAVSAQRPAAAPSPSRAARQHGGEAVGRRVRVWLRLDDEVEQQHDGRIVECTPTGWVGNELLRDEFHSLLGWPSNREGGGGASWPPVC